MSSLLTSELGQQGLAIFKRRQGQLRLLGGRGWRGQVGQRAVGEVGVLVPGEQVVLQQDLLAAITAHLDGGSKCLQLFQSSKAERLLSYFGGKSSLFF